MLVLASILNDASSKEPVGAVSVGDKATTIITFPLVLAPLRVVFSTTVDILELVVISEVNLIFDGSKLKTTLAKAAFLLPAFTIMLTFVAGGILTLAGEKLISTSAGTVVGEGITIPQVGIGALVGDFVGDLVGDSVGLFVGDLVGLFVGDLVGVGVEVGMVSVGGIGISVGPPTVIEF